MKVSLLIVSGPHQGEAVPVTVSPFLIGRDASCHLRPATSVVSKKHCGIILRDEKVFIADYGSTNGTLVGDLVLRKSETEVEDGVSVTVARYGPLEFKVQIEQSQGLNDDPRLPREHSDSPPLFKVQPDEAPPIPARAPTQPVQHPAARIVPPPAPPARPIPANVSDYDSESIAALLLRSDPGADDDLPECGTMKIIGSSPAAEDCNPDDENENRAAEILHNAKPDPNAKKGGPTPEEMSSAANELLGKLRRAAKPPPGCRFLSSPPES